MSTHEIDLRKAINAVSDVVQNRPRPLREFDQIYMKTGDMLLQSELVANWANGKRLAFIGDGDAISICVAYLQKRGIINYGPSKITVFDFDERICNAIKYFADRENLDNLSSVLYNCLHAFPLVAQYDMFYTNPPWGASNNGESVNIFTQRGIESVTRPGDGLIVIADDKKIPWTQKVLLSTQKFAMQNSFYIEKLSPRMHHYHLDDAPDLKSCNIFITSSPDSTPPTHSHDITDKERLSNFYGQNKHIMVKYVRDKLRFGNLSANDNEYHLETFDTAGDA